jgi:predicted ferric reductase
MKLSAQTYAIIAGLAVFIGLPMLFYGLGDAPRRSLLKEVISVATLLGFIAMLGQFFLARGNETLLGLFKPPQIQKLHKYIAYSAVAVILLHPVLIVLPRMLEGGIQAWDAFVTMVTDLGNLGIVAGLIAWVLLLVLSVTAFLRKTLIPHFKLRYRGWRYFHGGLAVAFTVLALWHSIALGRHTDVAMSAFLLTLAALGFAMLAHMYWGAAAQKPKSEPAESDPKGALR